ncbi:hypothetical protein AM500_22075 [Bacillus sp. FJAT-18017]|uniref:sensor histidine kinase n=1 Tax=Bacillus sp. FJAT-18017 TaxID=1705566 RepID=UPI0006BD35B0|nr:HAMP domain-containing sensor histidine kinase [Bacillus sp. FJAT-18017]ALC92943.1 hypothetical protein AM500_22075 [Bacillus sp. FJAT-18017]
MSIQKKLMLAFGAMLVVPILFFLIAVSALMLVYGEEGRLSSYVNELERIARRDELFGELKLMTTAEPDKLEQETYLNEMDSRLNKYDYELIIRIDGKLTYTDEMFKGVAIEDKLPSFGSFVNQVHESVEVDGKPFKFRQHDYVLPDGREGSIFIVEEATSLEQFALKHLPVIMVICVLALLLTNGLLSYIVSRGIINPMKLLQDAAGKIMAGNLDFKLETKRKDEIGELIEDFEKMREKLKESIDRQIQFENDRKLLLSNISHDLKTPISSIKGYVEGIKDGIANTEEKRTKYIDIIYKRANEMDAMINELFLTSTLDLNQVPFHFEKVDLTRYIKDIAEVAELELRKKGIQLLLEMELELTVLVKADREKLMRVFNNIFQNSSKYMDKEAGKIEISLKERDGFAVVKIQDNGPGIQEESLPRVFDTFYRAEDSRNKKTGGSGLGLTIAKQIVEMHNGLIRVESIEGEGTTMIIALPLMTPYSE